MNNFCLKKEQSLDWFKNKKWRFPKSSRLPSLVKSFFSNFSFLLFVWYNSSYKIVVDVDYKLKFKQNCLLISIELLLVRTGVHHIGRITETQQLTNPLLILHFFLSSHSLYMFSRLDFKLSNNLIKLTHCILKLLMKYFFGIFS